MDNLQNNPNLLQNQHGFETINKYFAIKTDKKKGVLAYDKGTGDLKLVTKWRGRIAVWFHELFNRVTKARTNKEKVLDKVAQEFTKAVDTSVVVNKENFETNWKKFISKKTILIYTEKSPKPTSSQPPVTQSPQPPTSPTPPANPTQPNPQPQTPPTPPTDPAQPNPQPQTPPTPPANPTQPNPLPQTPPANSTQPNPLPPTSPTDPTQPNSHLNPPNDQIQNQQRDPREIREENRKKYEEAIDMVNDLATNGASNGLIESITIQKTKAQEAQKTLSECKGQSNETEGKQLDIAINCAIQTQELLEKALANQNYSNELQNLVTNYQILLDKIPVNFGQLNKQPIYVPPDSSSRNSSLSHVTTRVKNTLTNLFQVVTGNGGV